MDREFAELRRGYLAEQRRMADDPEPCEPEPLGAHDAGGEAEACPFGRAWCDPTADLDDGFPCLSCHLRRDRNDGGPHPAVAAVADGQGTGD